MPGPKTCTKCNVSKEQTHFTATQYKRAGRVCKACCPSGDAEAATAAAAAASAAQQQQKSDAARQAASARAEAARDKAKAQAGDLPKEEARNTGKDLRERDVKAGRNAKNAEHS
jgi:hypothetical protein